MDLQELSVRTGITKRKLRYVLDNQLVPDLKFVIAESETGRPRKFHWDVGFAIVCAAQLLVAGLSHDSIRIFLKELAASQYDDRPVLPCIFDRYKQMRSSTDRFQAHACWGDGVNFRVTIETLEHTPNWRAPGNPAQLDSTYEPIVQVVLSLGKILDEVVED